MTFLYRAAGTGVMRVEVSNNGYDLPVTYTITVAPVGE
jgi:hypothetical protein